MLEDKRLFTPEVLEFCTSALNSPVLASEMHKKDWDLWHRWPYNSAQQEVGKVALAEVAEVPAKNVSYVAGSAKLESSGTRRRLLQVGTACVMT